MVLAWLAVEFKSSRVQEFVSNIVKSSDNCGPIVKRVPAGYEPMIKRVASNLGAADL